jgi:hypothetical protein
MNRVVHIYKHEYYSKKYDETINAYIKKKCEKVLFFIKHILLHVNHIITTELMIIILTR